MDSIRRGSGRTSYSICLDCSLYLTTRRNLSMGASTRKKGVLKLVHPGRHVEVHRRPITAAEIMRKNPNHCIARPDVFQFPWIIVRPESVLLPGNVFYIVPHRTIYRLLKAREFYEQPFSPQDMSPEDREQPYLPKHASPLKSATGMSLCKCT